jgi:ArsR family transcriptional regulator
MAGFLKILRLLGDEGRIRILGLLEKEELSVAELQEILGMGQSRISMQLSQLKQAGLVDVRRVGQKSLYRVTPSPGSQALLAVTLRRSRKEISAMADDQEAPADPAQAQR